MQRRTDTPVAGDGGVGGYRVVVRQIGARPLYLGNRHAAGDDDVTHEFVETCAAPGVPVLSLGGGDLPSGVRISVCGATAVQTSERRRRLAGYMCDKRGVFRRTTRRSLRSVHEVRHVRSHAGE